MKNYHLQSIVTNARRGLPVSTANRPRPRLNRQVLTLLGLLVAFWGLVAWVVASIA